MGSYFEKPGSDPSTFSYQSRKRRMGHLASLLSGRSGLNVLDLGGTVEFWEINVGFLKSGTIESLEVVNLDFAEISERRLASGEVLRCHPLDATSRSGLYRDRYDLVFSNSVIEHVGNLESQKRMSSVIQQVGETHFIQTPSRRFPIEPHFHVPFFAFLPLWTRTEIHRRWSCGFMGRQPNWLKARIACENTRLLSLRELKALFPESRIIPERTMGLVRSWLVTNLPTSRESGHSLTESS
jgi:hypothetical protein